MYALPRRVQDEEPGMCGDLARYSKADRRTSSSLDAEAALQKQNPAICGVLPVDASDSGDLGGSGAAADAPSEH